MEPQKHVLLITTTRAAIRAHLRDVAKTHSNGWLISPEEYIPIDDINNFTPTNEWFILLDEKIGLSSEQEEALNDLLLNYVIHWVWHSVSSVIDLPHEYVYKQREHSQSGTVTDLLFHWRNADHDSDKVRILRKHFETSRYQALELHKRSYLNTYTHYDLAEVGKKYLKKEELNYIELQLLSLYPELGEKLIAFEGEKIPEHLYHKRLQLAEFFYPSQG